MTPEERAAFEQKGRERDEHFRKLVEINLRDQAVVMARLSTAGFPANAIAELIPKYARFPPPLTELLLECLQETSNRRVREAIVRSLCGASPGYDPTVLIQAFDKEDESLSFAIVNTLIVSNPSGAAEFLRRL